MITGIITRFRLSAKQLPALDKVDQAGSAGHPGV